MILEGLINKYDQIFNNSRRHSSIQIFDNKMITIEVCFGITEFDENRIKVELARSQLIVTGLELKMRNFNKYGIQIKGNIHSVEFEEK